MNCSRCNKKFSNDSISVLRQEDNYTVIRVICSNCEKNIGLAILGIDKNEMRKTVEMEEGSENLSPDREEPIDYDDVLNAHEFFTHLGSDWSKHISE